MRENQAIIFRMLCAGLLIAPIQTISAKQQTQPMIAGWLETVVMAPWETRLRAKLDTGAKTSSINASALTYFEKDGTSWVRFQLPQGKNKTAPPQLIETRIVREAKIKRHNMEPSTRPVVKLAFCINSRYYETEFTLADRNNYNYPVLLGRRFLQHNILVDPSATFIHSTRSKKQRCINPDASKPALKSTS